MTDIDNLIERLRRLADASEFLTNGGYLVAAFHEAASALDAYRKATGGLTLETTRQTLTFARRMILGVDAVGDEGLTQSDCDALRAATFEEPT